MWKSIALGIIASLIFIGTQYLTVDWQILVGLCLATFILILALLSGKSK